MSARSDAAEAGPAVAARKTAVRRRVNRLLSPTARRRYRRLKRSVRQAQQRTLDRIFGTDTAGIVQDPLGRGKTSGHEYQATTPFAFARLTRKVPEHLAPFTFVDIGSGKGAVLLYATRYPFGEIIGLEHAEGLHHIAVANIEAFRSRWLSHMQCRLVTSRHQDATTFEWPLTPLVIFLFSPLPRAGLTELLANLERSLATSPRVAYLLAINPFDELYDAEQWLEPIYRGWDRAVIYKAEPTA